MVAGFEFAFCGCFPAKDGFGRRLDGKLETDRICETGGTHTLKLAILMPNPRPPDCSLPGFWSLIEAKSNSQHSDFRNFSTGSRDFCLILLIP